MGALAVFAAAAQHLYTCYSIFPLRILAISRMDVMGMDTFTPLGYEERDARVTGRASLDLRTRKNPRQK